MCNIIKFCIYHILGGGYVVTPKGGDDGDDEGGGGDDKGEGAHKGGDKWGREGRGHGA